MIPNRHVPKEHCILTTVYVCALLLIVSLASGCSVKESRATQTSVRLEMKSKLYRNESGDLAYSWILVNTSGRDILASTSIEGKPSITFISMNGIKDMTNKPPYTANLRKSFIVFPSHAPLSGSNPLALHPLNSKRGSVVLIKASEFEDHVDGEIICRHSINVIDVTSQGMLGESSVVFEFTGHLEKSFKSQEFQQILSIRQKDFRQGL